MLYSVNSEHDFAALSQILHAFGMPEETLAVMRKYLDLSKPRDNSLLDAIQPQYYAARYYLERDFEKAIEKDIVRRNEQELYDRYILFCCAAGGETCMNIGMFSFGKSYQEQESLAIAALSDRYGEDAEAVLYAAQIYQRQVNIDPKSPDICFRALKFTEHFSSRLILAMFLLDGTELPKKGILSALKGTDAKVKQALEIIMESAASGNKENADLIGAALAEASYFSLQCQNQLLTYCRNRSCAAIAKTAIQAARRSHGFKVDRVLHALNRLPELPDGIGYINTIANTFTQQKSGPILRELAERFPKHYMESMKQQKEINILAHMETVYCEVHPDFVPAARNRTKTKCIKALAKKNTDYMHEITAYLNGDMTTAEFQDIRPKLIPEEKWWLCDRVRYCDGFGVDEFALRCICYQVMVNMQPNSTNDFMLFLPGVRLSDNPTKILDGVYAQGLPLTDMLNFASLCNDREKILAYFAQRQYLPELAKVDIRLLFANARVLLVELLGNAGSYSEKLLAMADDSSKAVRAALADNLPQDEDTIRTLLTAKKSSKREIAASMLKKNMQPSLRGDVEKAFEMEKVKGLKQAFADLLGASLPEEMKKAAAEDIVTELTKGSKSQKVRFLFENPYSPVKKTDGTDADDAYLQALLLCYAGMAPIGRSGVADGLAAGLQSTALEKFVAEVFARWMNQGAPAKTKWVLYFAAIHGGMSMIEVLVHTIKEWSEHSRGAIAAEAVRALAMNGSSPALIAVDNMARKFKNKQVRFAAGAALEQAAEALGLTREELADQIVPDLGFDENLCRVFDFGTRQFKVYLTPALELEIFEGDKRLKNLPKPGAKDDAEKAEAAVKDFKEMKKQMKAAIQSQRQRLEYVLLCDRKWTTEGWCALFIRKAVMHSFAIGLIWGVYENGKLTQSFRYMEDGSFNTPDEEEYTLPENAEIGLVHPMELDEDTLTAWREQLEDYEITQPFPQLNRPVFRLTDAEKQQTELRRFEGTELMGLTLLGRMTKFGWDKGMAMDAGIFYNFVRTDVERNETQGGKTVCIGYQTELQFSGMYIAISYDTDETVKIENIVFRKPGAPSKELLKLGDISERYMSEILAQLSGIFLPQGTE